VSDPKLISLEQWAAAYFAPPPSLWTLRKMVRDGKIIPRPVKVGKAYYVAADAAVIDPTARPTLVQRMRHA
jgi:hypothetical protein